MLESRWRVEYNKTPREVDIAQRRTKVLYYSYGRKRDKSKNGDSKNQTLRMEQKRN